MEQKKRGAFAPLGVSLSITHLEHSTAVCASLFSPGVFP